ncbi:hypothetical protein [Leisingera sp. NJS204]|uniref:hypothetical protein n=1 Tax=Leisingera sp. NJS204 TaxID=2508307 RepID=UPI0010119F3C|nr:hypothetical protein [Leisingera sp. NJS204]QAX31296.1 hypothetical protein ETW24_18995 [Leisingera sp. NJS204]
MSLEQQIENLAGRVGGVEKQQEKTNNLLSEILAVLQRDGLPPATDNVVQLDEAAAPDDEAPTKEPEPEDEAPEDTPEDEAATLEATRDALMAFNSDHGRPATIALIERFIDVGAKPILGSIPEGKYAEVIAACAEEPEKAAA